MSTHRIPRRAQPISNREVVVNNHMHIDAPAPATVKPAPVTVRKVIGQTVNVNKYGLHALSLEFPAMVPEVLRQSVEVQVVEHSLTPVILAAFRRSLWWYPQLLLDHVFVNTCLRFTMLSVLYVIIVNLAVGALLTAQAICDVLKFNSAFLIFKIITVVARLLSILPWYLLGLVPTVVLTIVTFIENAIDIVVLGPHSLEFVDLVKFESVLTPDRLPDDPERLQFGDVRPIDLAQLATGATSSATLAVYEVITRDFYGTHRSSYPVFRELMDRFMRHYSSPPTLENGYDWLTHNGAYNLPAEVEGVALSTILRCMTRFCTYQFARTVAEERHDRLVQMTKDQRWLSGLLKRVIVIHYERIHMGAMSWLVALMMVLGFLIGVPVMLLGQLKHAVYTVFYAQEIPSWMAILHAIGSLGLCLPSATGLPLLRQVIMSSLTPWGALLLPHVPNIAIGFLMCVLPQTMSWERLTGSCERRRLRFHRPTYPSSRQLLLYFVAVLILSWTSQLSKLTSETHTTTNFRNVSLDKSNMTEQGVTLTQQSNLTSNLEKDLQSPKPLDALMQGTMNQSALSDLLQEQWMQLLMSYDALLNTSPSLSDRTTYAEFCPTYTLEMMSRGLDSFSFLLGKISTVSGSTSLTILLLKHISLLQSCALANS